MVINPDITKPAQQVIFSCKNTKPFYPTVFLNESHVANTPYQKHLEMHLDEKFNVKGT